MARKDKDAPSAEETAEYGVLRAQHMVKVYGKYVSAGTKFAVADEAAYVKAIESGAAVEPEDAEEDVLVVEAPVDPEPDL